jgi:hypothetical protein
VPAADPIAKAIRQPNSLQRRGPDATLSWQRTFVRRQANKKPDSEPPNAIRSILG